MKRFLYLLIPMILSACSVDRTEDIIPSTQQGHALVTLHARNDNEIFDAAAPTRSDGSVTEAAGEDTEIHDLNIYIWHKGTSAVRHVYVTDTSSTLFLTYGTHEIRVVANLGQSYHVEGITDSPESLDDPNLFRIGLFNDRRTLNVMTYAGEMKVDANTTDFSIRLTRIVSKIYYGINSEFSNYVILSAQVCNLTTDTSIFPQEGDDLPGENCYTDGDAVLPDTQNAGNSLHDTFYMYENIKPKVPSVTTEKERIPANAPERATHLLIRFYHPNTPNKIYTSVVYMGDDDVSDFSVRRNCYKAYHIRIYGPNDVRISSTTLASTIQSDDLIYTGQAEHFALADITLRCDRFPELETGRWWLKIKQHSSYFTQNDDLHLAYSRNGGATWQRHVSEDLFDISPSPTEPTVTYRLALYLSEKFQNFNFGAIQPKFDCEIYYGDATDPNKLPVRRFTVGREVYYPIYFDVRMANEEDWTLEKITIGGKEPDDWDSCAGYTYYMPIVGQDVDVEFSFPTYYTYLGAYYDDGTKMPLYPVDEELVKNGRVVYSGDSSGIYCAKGPGTIWFTFEDIDVSDRELWVPNTTSLHIDISFDNSYSKRVEDEFDVYTVPFGTVATIASDADDEFEGWFRKVVGTNTEVQISSGGNCRVEMHANYVLAPRWYTAQALDAGATYANCYVVKKGGYYTFRATRGGSADNIIVPSSIEVLWQDDLGGGAPQIIRNLTYDGSTGEVRFRCDDETEGSALIVAKNARKEILWSWHIWRTNYTPTADLYGLMTRNLGALRNASSVITDATQEGLRGGYIYQPGRHEPFPFISHETQDEAHTFGKLKFASTPSGPEETYGGYWNTQWNTGTKSVQDPCPYGWRVPKRNDLNGTKLNIFENSSTSYSTSYNYVLNKSVAFPLYGVYYLDNNRVRCKYNAWSDNIRKTVYAYTGGYFEVSVQHDRDIYKPLVLQGSPAGYDASILGGMVRCIRDE
ncbi:MAG: DUF4906 domain-containing protein [Alistipes senegalensis]|nr:DUF4906 domain-containing protein [Bacteroides cellulosilyticus]MCM1351315.1 DUF4906 domain-containing protein [Alistipes senegalensis]